MNRYWLLMGSICLLGCAASNTYRAGEVMSEGERLYRANCRACHSLRDPASHTDAEWPGLVRRYGGKISLTPETEQKILNYLQSANLD